VAVGAVVLNRVSHPSFPDSIAGVVYQPGAFTAITDGQINEKIAESSRKAAKEALNGADPSGGAIYYYNPKKTSNKWIRSRPVIKQIGAHLFCR
ncbi:MAG: spore cortex-lytic enzyme, partial [Oscillospiraceae bacterium]|nr:spore cortex-lytic enzyme [Oscillospiraceae bacterium]